MKSLRKLFKEAEAKHSPWLPYEPFFACERESFDSPAFLITEKSKLLIPCLFCDDFQCSVFSKIELPNYLFSQEKKVCPKLVISIDKNEEVIRISDECIGCGLCLLRCPYGAIFLNNHNRASIIDRDNRLFHHVTCEEFSNSFCNVPLSFTPIMKNINSFIKIINKNIRNTDKKFFYPYVGKLLTNIGLPTKITRDGDTNVRMDAIISIKEGVIPVEIKSPTETEKISVKAIRQALENKIVLLARTDSYAATNINITTLIVGFEKPNERSDILELIEDIYITYSIKIGILSLNDLLKLSIIKYQNGSINLDEIIQLKGFLS